MGRTKVVTEQESVNEIVNEKEIETTDTVVTEQEKPRKTKEKIINDDDVVKVKNISFANKSLIGINGKIIFDNEGICEVKGNEAKRLISIGFSIAK